MSTTSFVLVFVFSFAFVYAMARMMLAGFTDAATKVLMRLEKERDEKVAAAVKEEAEQAAIDGMEPVARDTVDDEDVCLRPGTRVRCNLSDCTHTHGTLIGFSLNFVDPKGAMLAMVSIAPDVPVLAIDVDRVDPEEAEGDEGGGIPRGYRDSAKPDSSKAWN